MAKILSGKELAQNLKIQMKKDFESAVNIKKIPPKLIAVLVGNDSASEIYIALQKKTCAEFGIEYVLEKFPSNISKVDMESMIDSYNSRRDITGVIIQLPLPENLDHDSLIRRLSPDKDAEGLHPANIGKLFSGYCGLAPCTPAAIMELLNSIKLNLRGSEVVIVGHSKIVGKPLAIMLLNQFATVCVCHIGTSEKKLLKGHIQRADILISAVGAKGFRIPGAWVKKNAVVIDVATNGDVDFNSASRRASYITPVPGGVGPLTNVMLIKNLLKLYKRHK